MDLNGDVAVLPLAMNTKNYPFIYGFMGCSTLILFQWCVFYWFMVCVCDVCSKSVSGLAVGCWDSVLISTSSMEDKARVWDITSHQTLREVKTKGQSL